LAAASILSSCCRAARVAWVRCSRSSQRFTVTCSVWMKAFFRRLHSRADWTLLAFLISASAASSAGLSLSRRFFLFKSGDLAPLLESLVAIDDVSRHPKSYCGDALPDLGGSGDDESDGFSSGSSLAKKSAELAPSIWRNIWFEPELVVDDECTVLKNSRTSFWTGTVDTVCIL